jgi:hypothetical protein
MCDVNWLVFLEDDMDDFFSDINIPLNCVLLVARSEGDRVVLTEVYRIAPALPLQTHTVAEWNMGNVSWPRYSLYQRRSDLQGLVIKTGTIHVILNFIVSYLLFPVYFKTQKL